MPESYFMAGKINDVNFFGQIKFIQTPASHTIDFSTTNNLPAIVRGPTCEAGVVPCTEAKKIALFKSRILVLMPQTLTPQPLDDILESLQVKEMTGKLMKPKIYLVTDDDGIEYDKYKEKVYKHTQDDIDHGHLCGSKHNRVCYAIEPQEAADIAAGDFRLRIFSTVNQVSVTKIGGAEVCTQQWDADEGKWFMIDSGAGGAGFESIRSGVSVPVGKKLLSVGEPKSKQIMTYQKD